MKWEFDVLLRLFLPFLTAKEGLRFSLVNRTMRRWRAAYAKNQGRALRHYVSPAELRAGWHGESETSKRYAELYKKLRRRGWAPTLPISPTGLSILLFYLWQRRRPVLLRLLHAVPSFSDKSKRLVWQSLQRVQLGAVCAKGPIKAGPRATSSTERAPSSMSSIVNNTKRTRTAIPGRWRPRKRVRKTVQRYTPAATKFLDDKSEDDGEEDLSGDEGVESRSEDEESEGSLKDFIASSEDESSESAVDSNADEEELSSRETDNESDFSVYSDED